jgi:aryl-alcohol dehydrogenase-like predicted oxidoreductase
VRHLPLGHSDVRVSQLGLGCMGMSEAYGAGNEAGSEAIARAKSATTSQLALARGTAQGEDVVALPGTKRRSSLQENLRAEEVTLDATDLARLEALGGSAGARYDEAALRQTNA